MSGMNLLLSDSRGVYIPRDFADFGAHWDGVTAEDLEILAVGPDHEHYWDAWDAVLGAATYIDGNDNVWHLSQDGDLWAICPDLMTDEEYYGYYGEHRSDLDADSRLETDNWYDTSAELR
jgi:hypothetical protein